MLAKLGFHADVALRMSSQPELLVWSGGWRINDVIDKVSVLVEDWHPCSPIHRNHDIIFSVSYSKGMGSGDFSCLFHPEKCGLRDHGIHALPACKVFLDEDHLHRELIMYLPKTLNYGR